MTKVETPTGRQLQQLHELVRSVVEGDRKLGELSRRDLRSVPWVLFLPAATPERWLARNSGLWKDYSTWIGGSGRARAVAALVHVLLQNWDAEEAYFDRWRITAENAIQSSSSRRLQQLKENCEAHQLLSRDGPQRLFGQAFEHRAFEDQFLDHAGLSAQLEYSDFVRTGLLSLMDRIRGGLDRDTLSSGELSSVLHLMVKPDVGGLRFESLRLPLVQSLLTPFQQRTPPSEVQEIVLNFLLLQVGDPRFKRSGWHALDVSLRDVVLRWLVRITLEDFFRILDETAIDRMWQQRRAFWSGYLDRGVITDAWLVLGGKARELARRAQEGQAGWGNLDGYYDHKQSVLLMRLAGLTIAEWSHNGKCCFWKHSNPQRPRLYDSGAYWADSLRDKHGADESFVHVHTGKWMPRVERYIQRETGVKRLG